MITYVISTVTVDTFSIYIIINLINKCSIFIDLTYEVCIDLLTIYRIKNVQQVNIELS